MSTRSLDNEFHNVAQNAKSSFQVAHPKSNVRHTIVSETHAPARRTALAYATCGIRARILLLSRAANGGPADGPP
jgi:hypothetical protein